MDNLYFKDKSGNYLPIRLDIAAGKELTEKLIVVTVGTNEEPCSSEALKYVQQCFMETEIIIDAAKHSDELNLLILPHTIQFQLISKEELETKAICVRLSKNDDLTDFPEIKEKLNMVVAKDIIELPAPLSLKEYKEVKSIVERARIRKQRYGGGLEQK